MTHHSMQSLEHCCKQLVLASERSNLQDVEQERHACCAVMCNAGERRAARAAERS